ncbi:MAG: hypothetical protein AAGE94_18100 [Acidobacteriota bacterium]
MDVESIRVLSAVAAALFVVGLPIAGLVWLHRHPEWWTGKYPDWVYGMETRLRLNIKRMVMVLALGLAAIGLVDRGILESGSQLALAGIVATLFVVVAFHGLGVHRRAFERTADEGVEVVARILGDREQTLGHPRYVGGAELVAQAAVAFGAALIWKGQWTMEIEFDVEGRTVVDRRRVSSQTYYRFASGDTMPILVRADQPKAWVPVLGDLPWRDETTERRGAPSA